MGNKSISDVITFTRSSSASYFDSSGTIRYAKPNDARYDHGTYFQEADSNMFATSRDFSHPTWLKTRATVTSNSTTAPDGTVTAYRITEDTSANATHYVYSSIGAISGTVYTISFYVKIRDQTRTIAGIQFYTTNGVFDGGSAAFNLSTGTLYYKSGGVTSATIESVGDGWYRISATSTAVATALGNVSLNSGTNTSLTYTGDGVKGLYFWGAMANIGASPLPYNAQYVSGLKGILFEETRTNLALYSSLNLSGFWIYQNGTTVTQNQLAPNGLNEAIKISGLNGETIDTNGTAIHSSAISVTAGTTYTASVYVKPLSPSSTDTFRLRLKTTSTSNSSFTTSATLSSSDWTRVSVTFTVPVGDVAATFVFGSLGPIGDVYLWGAQLEAGEFPTSYIPTSSATATRSADLMTMRSLDFSNSTEGTIFVENIYGANLSSGVFGSPVSFYSNGTNRIVLTYNPAYTLGTYVQTPAGAQIDINAYYVLNQPIKSGLSYADNNSAYSYEGNIQLDNVNIVPTGLTTFQIGNNAGTVKGIQWMKSLKYYPKRLSNAELQALTS